MHVETILQNKVLISSLIAWLLAQGLKVPFEFLRSHRWKWGMLFYAGGMPSSHSALMVGATHAIGLHYGFDDPVFALGVAITMIVIYDAAGVRRQAGMPANFAMLVSSATLPLESGEMMYFFFSRARLSSSRRSP